MATIADDMKVAELSEAVVHYHDVGTGPVVLALHGGGPGAFGWSNFAAVVAEMSSQFRMIVPDQPGFGKSYFTNDKGDNYHIASARSMLELLDKLGIEKAHIIGNSMGGGVGIRMAMQAPEKLDRLIMMGSYFYGFAKPFLGAVPEGNPVLLNYYPDPTIERMKEMARMFVYDIDTIPNAEEMIKTRFELTKDPKVEAGYRRMMSGTPDPDTRTPWEKVSSVKHKTLIVWGKDDRFCHLEDAFQWLTALDNSELVVLRDTGHWVMIERPKEFASHVMAFLNR